MAKRKIITDEVIYFLKKQDFVIISTIGQDKMPHNSCKGIVKIYKSGKICVLDLYKGCTYKNIKRNSKVSITVVDGHKFKGYTIKGIAKIVKEDKVKSHIMKIWEQKITDRVTSRILKNIRGQKGHPRHPEILLPKPQYLIMMEPKEVVDLTPQALK